MVLGQLIPDVLHDLLKDVVIVEELEPVRGVAEANVARLDILIHAVDEGAQKHEHMWLLLTHFRHQLLESLVLQVTLL